MGKSCHKFRIHSSIFYYLKKKQFWFSCQLFTIIGSERFPDLIFKIKNILVEVKLPYGPVCPSVIPWVGPLVRRRSEIISWKFIKFYFHRFNRSNCLYLNVNIMIISILKQLDARLREDQKAQYLKKITIINLKLCITYLV